MHAARVIDKNVPACILRRCKLTKMCAITVNVLWRRRKRYGIKKFHARHETFLVVV